MRGNEGGGEQKVEVKEREEGGCVLLWRGEAARQKASRILLHKLRKLTHTLYKHTGGY